MSRTRAEYDGFWRRQPHRSRGPVEWRGVYHDVPDPYMDALGTAADRLGLGLELSVKGGRPLGSPGREHRPLHRLIVQHDLEPVIIVDIGRAGGMTAAARTAFRAAAALRARSAGVRRL